MFVTLSPYIVFINPKGLIFIGPPDLPQKFPILSNLYALSRHREQRRLRQSRGNSNRKMRVAVLINNQAFGFI